MRERPTAIGYLRRDVSGISQTWDEIQIRSLSKRLGYDLAKTVVFGSETEHLLVRLIGAVRRADADAVIVPSTLHFYRADIPVELVHACDVVTVNPEATYARSVASSLTLHDSYDAGKEVSSDDRGWNSGRQRR
ncbi:hypothetical protein [Nocardia goodfellowii]|uniref:Resolvase/invertase-type recombinase catalytic domain-containing protein n=1 Tax=Nocardia goodfellowii TaxID=882446 RepID=A0ABS4QR69_9NOCA|nr:hypothetical protein [Nocardia goodfellowii]MBP2194179.1 hypothetical protein [Nocardia goodfellowii]